MKCVGCVWGSGEVLHRYYSRTAIISMGTANQVETAFFSQCSVTGRKWWVWSPGSWLDGLTASTHISGTHCSCGMIRNDQE